MGFVKFVMQDWQSNSRNTKGRVITLLFRIANYSRDKGRFLKILFTPYLLFYKLFIEWGLGIEIPYKTLIGSGLKIYHGQALVINENSKLGTNCLIRHSTTIGNKGDSNKGCPQIGNNVNIGSNVCVLGKITIGDNVTIGAGSIVIKDVPSNSVVVGNPARVIRSTYNSNNVC